MTKQQDIVAICGSAGAALGIITDILESMDSFHPDKKEFSKRFCKISEELISIQKDLLKSVGVEL
jgi:hypothetical protein